MAWIAKHWFLLALTVVVLTAFGLAQELAFLLEYRWLRLLVVATVLFLMSLPLHLGAFTRVLLRPQAALLASVINLAVAPLLCLPWLALLDTELAGGLAVALSTPSTLASGAVWTRRSGGNDVTALMVTVLTNLSCVVLTPLWLQWLVAQDSVASIPLSAQVGKLTLLVVVPIVLAQLVRSIGPVGKRATAEKKRLSVVAQIGLLYVVLLGTLGSALRWQEAGSATVLQWTLLLSAIAVVHLALFGLGLGISGVLQLDSRDRRAVAISGSQKTLMVGAEMGLSLGLSVLPLVLYHLFQLFADTFLADWMKRRFDVQDSQSDRA